VPKQLVGLDGPEPAAAAAPPKGDANVRGDFNTLDCRGMRYDDAERETDYFLDRMLRQGASSAFVLHGHGTGALKKGLRSYLATHPLAKQAKPAAHDDGGDAFTRVVLRAAKKGS
jgi:DNA mismatch repair protein MutS2